MVYYLLIFTFIITVAYTILILYGIALVDKKIPIPAKSDTQRPIVSVVIVVRNEAKNIVRCLNSIVSNTYPVKYYEIILVDDHSDDNTVDLALSLKVSNLRILSLSDYDMKPFGTSFKKAGLSIGVSNAKGEYILTSDGDCWMEADWIETMAKNIHSSGNALITGKIEIPPSRSWLSLFQSFEIKAIMALTELGIQKGMWYSANAANMIFKKSCFLAYYATDYQISSASGDDIFFVEWLRKEGKSIGFNNEKEGKVFTSPMETMNDLWNQRIRWATKWKSLQNKGLIWVHSIIFLMCTSILVNLVVFSFLAPCLLYLVAAQFVIKLLADYALFKSINKTDSASINKTYWFVLEFIHLCYVLAMGAGSLFLTNYVWKGRRVS